MASIKFMQINLKFYNYMSYNWAKIGEWEIQLLLMYMKNIFTDLEKKMTDWKCKGCQ